MADFEATFTPHLIGPDNLEDNWTDVNDAKERRKRQNRQHQRAWRQRQAAQRALQGSGRVPGVRVLRFEKIEKPQVHVTLRPTPGPSTGAALSSALLNLASECVDPVDIVREELGVLQFYANRTRRTALPLPTSLPLPLRYPNAHIAQPIKELHALIRNFAAHIPVSSALLSNAFPLSPDHKLLTLIQYNVIRGMFTNIAILSLQTHIQLDCGYNLNIAPYPYDPSSCPANFEPTRIQQTVDHSLWIDTLPSAQLRDSMILNQDMYDADDICDDILGGLYEGFDDVEVRGIMLWGEPWSEDAWEFSEGFVRKWGFLLRGCKNMVDSTNRWRELRGEERLHIPL